MADEIQKFIIEVQNEGKLRELNALYTAQKKTVEELLALQTAAGKFTPAQQRMYESAAAGAVASAKEVQNLSRSMNTFGSQGMMQLGYALQDFMSVQGGLAQKINAVSNNLQMVALSMGMSGKMFMGITAFIQGIQLLAQNADTISSLLMGLDPEAVSKAGAKTKETMEKFKAMQARPAAGADTGKLVSEAITDAGQPVVAKGIAEAMRAANIQLPMNPDQMKRLMSGMMYRDIGAAIPNIPGLGGVKKGISEQFGKLEEQIYGEQVADLMVKAQSGDKNAKITLQRILKNNPGAFPPGVANAISLAASGFSVFPSDPNIGPGRAEAEQQLMMDAARGGGPAFLPSPSGVFGTGAGGGAKTPAQQAEEQSRQAAQAHRTAVRAQIAAKGGIEQRNIADVPGGPSGIVGGDEREAALLAAEGSSIQAAAMADRMLGMGASRDSLRLYAIEARLQQLMMRMGNQFGGAGNGGEQYSAIPPVWGSR